MDNPIHGYLPLIPARNQHPGAIAAPEVYSPAQILAESDSMPAQNQAKPDTWALDCDPAARVRATPSIDNPKMAQAAGLYVELVLIGLFAIY